MNPETYKIRFIAPLFSYGSFADQPEIRPASIRGQLHWWLRATGGSPEQEAEIFGTVHKRFGGAGKAKASKLVVRVSHVQGETREIPTLPHKRGGHAAPRNAYAPGTTFKLHLLFRGQPLSEASEIAFRKALHAWLRYGSLGLRGTRGAGSFVVEDQIFQFDSEQQFRQDIDTFMQQGPKCKLALLEKVFSTPEEALLVMSDTIGGRSDSRDQMSSLEKINFPLGAMRPRRKTSPLRFRLIEVSGKYQILSIWDTRSSVTGNTDDHRREVIRMLVDRNKEIGSLLMQSALG